jgi:6-pyruvoyltetrahydropterin/6-carboxytetrahydropterin synthase
LKEWEMKIGIIEHMDCAHFLPGHDHCGVLHGHTYKVEVVISGEKNSGMVMDFSILKKTVKAVLGDYDHRTLNDLLEYPSVENVCEAIFARLKNCLQGPLSVRIWEGEGKWAELSD